jgi:purine nucleosidase
MNAKKPLIIDCDPGIDDSLALLLALNSPEWDILGITTVSGNVPATLGAENVLKILKLTNRLDVPVYVGAAQPLQVPYTSAQDTHGDDGLGNSHLPAVTEVVAHDDAVAFLRQTLTERPETTVLALGPLTNLAALLQVEPALFAKVDRFVAMGGSYKSHGNCSPVAEYNFWCDPDAAKIVLENTPVPLEMVGLDVTRQIVLTPSMLSYMQRVNPVLGDFIAKITQFYFDFHWQYERVIGCVINDPLAMAFLIDPTLLSGFDSYTTVATTGVARGQSIVDDHDFWHQPANSRILTQVNLEAFWRLFLTRVLKATEPDLSTTLQQLLEVGA